MKNVLSKHTDCQGRNQIKTPRKCDVDPQSFSGNSHEITLSR